MFEPNVETPEMNKVLADIALQQIRKTNKEIAKKKAKKGKK